MHTSFEIAILKKLHVSPSLHYSYSLKGMEQGRERNREKTKSSKVLPLVRSFRFQVSKYILDMFSMHIVVSRSKIMAVTQQKHPPDINLNSIPCVNESVIDYQVVRFSTDLSHYNQLHNKATKHTIITGN